MTLVWEGVSAHLGRREVLEDVSLAVKPGEILAIVGPNGAGKSTLLRTAVGLVPLSRGRVTWQGRDVAAMPARERARSVGLVPQRAHLDHPFTVREAVAMGRFAHVGPFGEPSADDLRSIEAALAATGLGPLADRPVTRLSGGEGQRVLLARVLAQAPQVFLLDEPIANLDLGQAQRTLRLARERAAAGAAVVAVLHDLEAAARVADRVAILSAGRLLGLGTPREALREDALRTAFATPVSVSWSDADVRIRAERPDP